jgi:hypothetical protein
MPDLSKGYYSAGKGGFGNTRYSPDQAYAAFLKMGESDQKRLQRYFERLAPKWGFQTTRSMWGMAIEAAENTEQTPWDVLEQAAVSKVEPPVDMSAGPSGGGGGGYGGPYRRETIDFTNETSARALVDRTLGQYLGRAATEKEAAQFYATLTKAERANPRIEQGVTTRGGGTGERAGGVMPEQIAKQFAMSRDDYAETQVETTVKSLIEKAIREDVQDMSL